jgi:hypothetical protein
MLQSTQAQLQTMAAVIHDPTSSVNLINNTLSAAMVVLASAGNTVNSLYSYESIVDQQKAIDAAKAAVAGDIIGQVKLCMQLMLVTTD